MKRLSSILEDRFVLNSIAEVRDVPTLAGLLLSSVLTSKVMLLCLSDSGTDRAVCMLPIPVISCDYRFCSEAVKVLGHQWVLLLLAVFNIFCTQEGYALLLVLVCFVV